MIDTTVATHQDDTSTDDESRASRLLIPAYALLAYVAFFATILYAIGFFANMLVPKGIDSGVGLSTLAAASINVALMVLFAVQHSVMARPFFKRWIVRFMPTAMERSTYVLLSSLALSAVFWQWQPMPEIVWSVDNRAFALVLTSAYFLGWAVVFLSSFMINHFELFGLKQAYEFCRRLPSAETPFSTRYFYAFVRHPLMLGFLILLWAAPTMSEGHLLASSVLTLYILVAVKYLEERDLRRAIGPAYAEYQKRVPMLLPRLGRRS